MKVAILGNMNNNGFSLLRYFTSQNHEARLFLFENDGTGTNNHFTWESDTWFTQKWKKKIVKTRLVNSHLQVFSEKLLLYIIIYIFHKLFLLFNLRGSNWLNPGVFMPGKYINKIFSDFDIIIGCGISPALFTYSKLNLSVFYPYSTGIEYYNSPASTTNLYLNQPFEIFIKYIINAVRDIQAKGIIASKNVFNAELSETKTALTELKKDFKKLPIPLVYLEKAPTKFPDHIWNLIKEIKALDFSIIMTSRQYWVPPKDKNQKWIFRQSKNNDWLIRAFGLFLKNSPSKNVKLLLLEYGKDVSATKQLISDYNLDNYIVWIPILPRREIMIILRYVSVSVGEFYHQPGTIWGGTAIEAIASGVPFINSLKFDNVEFKKLFEFELPPILPANSVYEIYLFLWNIYTDKDLRQKISKDSLEWFSKNYSTHLAKKWIDNS